MTDSQTLFADCQSANNTGRINCLFIVPSLKRAGAESQLIDLVNNLDNARFRKTMVVLEGDLAQLDKLDRDTVEVIPIPKERRLDFRQINKIAEHIDLKSIDIIHATIQYSVFIASMAMRRAKRNPKLVAAIHTTKNVGLKEELFDRLLYRNTLKHCEHIVFVCRHQREYWLSKYPELESSSSVIYNGVNPEHFRRDNYEQQGRALLSDLVIPEDSYRIACIAGFRKEKGHDILVNAFSRLPAQACLLLAGDGPMREETEALAIRLGVADRVHFLGNLPDVRPLLSASDLMVLASTAVETFSMAMLEAMSMQVPVVASDIGGLSEAIIEGETGSLVPAGDSDRLFSELEAFMKMENVFATRKRCRAVVLEKFTSEAMVSATEERLLEVNSGK